MSNPFQKATRSQVFLKLAITGPTGSGKTYSALRLAFGLLDGTDKRVAFLDTENDSASLYSDKFDFDVMPIAPPFDSNIFQSGIQAAEEAGYGVAIIDSASHFWKGVLDYKSKIDARGGNSYTNWKEADKQFDPFMEKVLQSKIHVIFCMRSKMEYILEDNGKGKQAPRKVGLSPVFRDGCEFEFTTVFDIAMDHNAQTSKDRSGLFDGKIFQITEDTGKQIAAWLKTATPKQEPALKPEPTEAEKHAANIAHLRKNIIEKERGSIPAADYENVFASYASAKFKDNKSRANLTEFTIEELKQIWTERQAITAVTLKHVTDSQPQAS